LESCFKKELRLEFRSDAKGENSMQTILSGRYEILSHLGRGGMAIVYHSRDLNLQREVAIKVLHDPFIEDPTFQASFLQEARAAANLSHPNIVTIFDFGFDTGRYFIVMEYIPGTDLKTMIRNEGALTVSKAVVLMIQICAGVGYAHRAGLIHCDLKPQNILVASDGRAKITDFGISRALANIQANEYTDTVWGSPLYLAPEQAAGSPPSPASDVYSLGVTFFEMLAGVLPFDGTDAQTLAELHRLTPPPSLREFNPEIPTALNQIVHKVLSKEPSARYRTADQFGRVLTTFTENLYTTEIIPQSQTSNSFNLSSEEALSEMGVEPSGKVDWLAVTLGLLAFIAIGGLIPLWLWVCLLYPSCPVNAW
jgi:serine/threonine protein kinase